MNNYFSEWHLTADSPRVLRLCVGAVCRDEHFWLDRLVLGRKNRIVDRFGAVGGGAANVARVLRRLAPETPIVLLAPVGDDREGLAIRRHMAERQIQMPWPAVQGGTTSLSFIVNSDGAGTVLMDEGVRRAPLPPGLLDQALARAEACCLVSPCNESVGPVTRLAASRGVRVFFGVGSAQVNDLGLEGLRAALAGPLELVICNRPEAAQLTGREKVEEMLEALRGVGAVRNVVITDGSAGMHGLGEEGYVRGEEYRDGRPVVDDVGAGDAAQATIVHCLTEGLGLEESMRAGARQGFEVCTARGTTVALVGAEELRGVVAEVAA